MLKKNLRVVGLVVALVVLAVPAFAFSPAVGDPGYIIYDYASRMSTGAVGATVGLGGTVWGATMLFKGQFLPAVGTILASVGIANSAALLTTMGILF